MLSVETLTLIEGLIMSRSHPMWGELAVLSKVLQDVLREKAAVSAAARAQPALPPEAPGRPLVMPPPEPVPGGSMADQTSPTAVMRN